MPQGVDDESLMNSSLVIALNQPEHEPMIRERFPKWVDRITYWNVADIDELSRHIALPQVEVKVELLVKALLQGHALGCESGALAEF